MSSVRLVWSPLATAATSATIVSSALTDQNMLSGDASILPALVDDIDEAHRRLRWQANSALPSLFRFLSLQWAK